MFKKGLDKEKKIKGQFITRRYHGRYSCKNSI